MTVKERILKFLEYVLFRLIVGFLQVIPLNIRIRLSEKLVLSAAHLLKKNVNIIKSNIQKAFPDKSAEWVNEIAQKNIKNMGKFVAEFLEVPYLHTGKSKAQIIHQPSKEKTTDWFKNGGILILGHIGNWEWHGSLVSNWMPGRIYAMAKRQSNPWSNKYFEKIRSSGGAKSIFTDGSIFEPIRIIKNKNMVGFLADQDAGKNGEFHIFLNQQASTFTGPAVLSRVTHSRVFFAYSYRNENKLYSFIEEIQTPSVDPKKNPDEWDRQFTQTWVSRLEEVVKKYPQDYFWAHNRWKTRPKIDV